MSNKSFHEQKQEENRRGDTGESNNIIRQKNELKASYKQLLYLFQFFETFLDTSLRNEDGDITKNSVKPIIDLYNDQLKGYRDAYTKQHDVLGIPLSIQTGDSIASLFKSFSGLKTSTPYLELIAGLALWAQDDITSTEEYATLVLGNKAWNKFVARHSSEINLFEQTQDYLFYFWHGDNVSMFRIVLLVHENGKSWQDCLGIQFYEYEHKSYKLLPANPTIHTIEEQDTGAAAGFLSLNISYYNNLKRLKLIISTGADISVRKSFFATYAGIDNSGAVACGIGLLVKAINIESELRQIINQGKPDDIIFNFLYERRLIIKGSLLEADALNELPNKKEIANISTIAHNWRGYYLRNNKPEGPERSEKIKGGIERVKLEIQQNGMLRMIFEKNDDHYYGFLSYPMIKNANKRFIKANLGLNKENRIYKLHLFLTVSKDNNFMEGTYTGWDSNGRPFASLIFFQKESNIGNLATSVTYSYHNDSGFISKTNITINDEITQNLIESLKNSNYFLSVAEDCLPDHLLFNTPIPYECYEGCYYLLSADYQLGLMDKAKLEIKADGTFTVDYKDVLYRGLVQYRSFSDVNPNGYLCLEIREKSQPNILKYVRFMGNYLFDISTLSLSGIDKLSKKITILPGLSLRINAEGTLQTKKEFLIPADDKTLFESEKAEKYTFNEDALLTNLLKDKEKEFIPTILAAKENNIILLKKPPKEVKARQTPNYGVLYFKAFLSDIYLKNAGQSIFINFIEGIIRGISKKDVEKLIAMFPNKKHVKTDLLKLFEELQKDILKIIKDFEIKDLLRDINSGKHHEISVIKKIETFIKKIEG